MLFKLVHETTVDRNDRKKFIPFVNERDFMGTLISTNRNRFAHKSVD